MICKAKASKRSQRAMVICLPDITVVEGSVANQLNQPVESLCQVSRCQPVSSQFSSCTCPRSESMQINGIMFCIDWFLSCHPANSFKALKETQNTDPNQWPGPIRSSSTTGFVMEGALPPLCQLLDASYKGCAMSSWKITILSPTTWNFAIFQCFCCTTGIVISETVKLHCVWIKLYWCTTLWLRRRSTNFNNFWQVTSMEFAVL